MSRYGGPGGSGILHSSYSGLLVALLKENKRDFPNDRDPTKFIYAIYPLVSLTGFSVAVINSGLMAPVHLTTTITSIIRHIPQTANTVDQAEVDRLLRKPFPS